MSTIYEFLLMIVSIDLREVKAIYWILLISALFLFLIILRKFTTILGGPRKYHYHKMPPKIQE